MGKIFITGSSDGLGQMCARQLLQQGHEVILHARNQERGQQALKRASGARNVLTADLANLEEVKRLANEANNLGPFDAVIHNAGVYQTTAREIVAVNVVAPYVLTCMMDKPKRLIYLSSGMHLSGRPNLESLDKNQDRVTYSDSKLQVVMLMLAVSYKFPDLMANAVDPGWVPTKMGGRNAPDDLDKGFETQCWLASSTEKSALVSGKYFYHKKERSFNPVASDKNLQDELLSILAAMTGCRL